VVGPAETISRKIKKEFLILDISEGDAYSPIISEKRFLIV